jgi:predicted DNA-binding transcriptional regulator AlpA
MHVTEPGVTGRAPLNADDLGLLPARRVMARYQVSDRTIDRWLDDPRLKFPRPIVINRRRYFRLSELMAWECERAAHTAA